MQVSAKLQSRSPLLLYIVTIMVIAGVGAAFSPVLTLVIADLVK